MYDKVSSRHGKNPALCISNIRYVTDIEKLGEVGLSSVIFSRESFKEIEGFTCIDVDPSYTRFGYVYYSFTISKGEQQCKSIPKRYSILKTFDSDVGLLLTQKPEFPQRPFPLPNYTVAQKTLKLKTWFNELHESIKQGSVKDDITSLVKDDITALYFNMFEFDLSLL